MSAIRTRDKSPEQLVDLRRQINRLLGRLYGKRAAGVRLSPGEVRGLRRLRAHKDNINRALAHHEDRGGE